MAPWRCFITAWHQRVARLWRMKFNLDPANHITGLLTVVNGKSYLWITVWCPSILSFFCQCLALVLHSFNSSPSQFSEIVFLKEHQINTTMKTMVPSTALLTWLITWSVVCSRPIELQRTCCSLQETPYFPPSQFKINSHSSSPAPQFAKKYSSHPAPAQPSPPPPWFSPPKSIDHPGTWCPTSTTTPSAPAHPVTASDRLLQSICWLNLTSQALTES